VIVGGRMDWQRNVGRKAQLRVPWPPRQNVQRVRVLRSMLDSWAALPRLPGPAAHTASS
jgi:hypothetical protein